uniref:Major facilitator superfamily transporter n=1 Tax=Ganoderma boninense TaxID=34458 RepID=A0A5K1K8G4_9APHY|nr:Major facilitator superfamily transporter [Ganoderma boninense]
MLREACGVLLLKGKIGTIRRMDMDVEGTAHSRWFRWEADIRLAESNAEGTFRAKWLVYATGRKASVAQKIGATTRKHSDLLAFYVVLEGVDSDTDLADSDVDTRTLIEAAANGWWYSARLPHRKHLVMYTTSPSNPTTRVARSAAGFLDMVHSDTVLILCSLRGTPHPDMHSADSSESTASVPLYERSPGTKFTGCTTAASSILEPYASWEPQHTAGDDSERGAGQDNHGWRWHFLGSVLARHLRPSPTDDGLRLGGGGVVDEIRRAYEDVRKKYEEGRAYYYSIITRFEAPGKGNEGNGRGFWEGQR